MSLSSLSKTITPDDVTLFLKNARHTIVLSVLPSTTFTEVARLLLLVLQSRNIKSVDDVTVPTAEQGDKVEFGFPRDIKDLKKGFKLLASEQLVVNDGKDGKKKGSKSGQNQLFEGAGLVDGSVLAFRFRAASDEEMEESEEAEAIDDTDDAGWNVEVPVLEDVE